ncbi:MAG: hypothetical protein LC798_08810 [Chloroflexi bacterium]|nr:hypothetical protein [Chloroflexota bacterium]
MAARPTVVYPVPGVFSVGNPTVAHEVDTKEQADELVKTGYYRLSQSEADAASPWSKEAIADLRKDEAAAAATNDEATESPVEDR